MAGVELEPEVTIGTEQHNWIGSAIAGIVAGIVFGLLAMVMAPEMMGMIGALYGFEGNVAVGWFMHLINSAIFGLIYAAIVSMGRLREYARRVTTGAGLGLVYGVVVWIVAASIVMPLWIGAVTAMSPAVPTFDTVSLVGHAVYGVLLGGVYPLILARMGR